MRRLVTLSLLAAAGRLAAADPVPAGAAAVVNGEVIPKSAVDAGVRKVAGPAARPPAEVRADVLAGLIDDALLRQYLRQHAPAVEPAEVDKLFQGLAEALKRQGTTPPDYFKTTGQTEAQARAAWADLLRFGKYADALATDAELRKYFAARRDQFDAGRVKAAQIVLRVGPRDQPAAAADRAAAHAKLAGLRADIIAGRVTFADAAKKHSIDPTAAAGGDLGTVGRHDGLLDPAVTAAAFAVPDGGVSEPVDGDFGVYLVTARGRVAGPPVAFEAVAELVREAFLDDVRGRLVAQLRARAVVTRAGD